MLSILFYFYVHIQDYAVWLSREQDVFEDSETFSTSRTISLAGKDSRYVLSLTMECSSVKEMCNFKQHRKFQTVNAFHTKQSYL